MRGGLQVWSRAMAGDILKAAIKRLHCQMHQHAIALLAQAMQRMAREECRAALGARRGGRGGGVGAAGAGLQPAGGEAEVGPDGTRKASMTLLQS